MRLGRASASLRRPARGGGFNLSPWRPSSDWIGAPRLAQRGPGRVEANSGRSGAAATAKRASGAGAWLAGSRELGAGGQGRPPAARAATKQADKRRAASSPAQSGRQRARLQSIGKLAPVSVRLLSGAASKLRESILASWGLFAANLLPRAAYAASARAPNWAGRQLAAPNATHLVMNGPPPPLTSSRRGGGRATLLPAHRMSPLAKALALAKPLGRRFQANQ